MRRAGPLDISERAVAAGDSTLYASVRAAKAAKVTESLRTKGTHAGTRPGQVGALVFLGKRWLGLDLLPSAGLFERVWPRLCAGYTAELLGTEGSPSAPDPRSVLEALAQAPVEEAPAVGLGREHRLAGNALAGAALVVEDTVAHLMAFPAGI